MVMQKPTRSGFTHIVVHPLNDDKAHEVWGTYVETHSHMGSFETDGIIGWIYPVNGYWIWVNEMGHPSNCFTHKKDLVDWIKQKGEGSFEWMFEDVK